MFFCQIALYIKPGGCSGVMAAMTHPSAPLDCEAVKPEAPTTLFSGFVGADTHLYIFVGADTHLYLLGLAT